MSDKDWQDFEDIQSRFAQWRSSLNEEVTMTLCPDDIMISSDDKNHLAKSRKYIVQMVKEIQRLRDDDVILGQPTHDTQPVQTDITSVTEPPTDMSQQLQCVTKQVTNYIVQPTLRLFCMLLAIFRRTSYVDRGVKNYSVGHHNLGVSSTQVPRNHRIVSPGPESAPSREMAEESKILDPVRHDEDTKMTKLHLSTGNGGDEIASFPPGDQIGGSQNSAE